jgi:hypothetical protein
MPMCFFSCSFWKILLFIPYGIFQVWYLLCFQCNVLSHRWKIKAQMKRSQMKRSQMKSHRWRLDERQSKIMHLWSLHLWLFICDLFICDYICDLFICAFIFQLWLGTLHWKHKRYQTWKMLSVKLVIIGSSWQGMNNI